MHWIRFDFGCEVRLDPTEIREIRRALDVLTRVERFAQLMTGLDPAQIHAREPELPAAVALLNGLLDNGGIYLGQVRQRPTLPPEIAEAARDWRAGRVYVDGMGNYRLRAGAHKGRVVPWSRAVKRLFGSSDEFSAVAEAVAGR